MTAEPLLQVVGLRRRFAAIEALRGVDLAVSRGEVLGFLGPNGAGKTTTMRIVAGCLDPDAGTVTIAGHDRLAEPDRCRALVGYVPQRAPLYPDARIRDQLDLAARLRGIERGARRHALRRVLEACDLLGLEARRCGRLSGGQRQRVGLAQALLGDPPLLVLDEPTAGLDPGQVANFRALLATLASERAVLLSTHILGEVVACCRRVTVVQQGISVETVAVSELSRRAAAQDRVRVRLRDPSQQAACLTALRAAGLQAESDDDGLLITGPGEHRDRLAGLAAAHGGLRELVEERRSLEEVFRDLVGAGR